MVFSKCYILQNEEISSWYNQNSSGSTQDGGAIVLLLQLLPPSPVMLKVDKNGNGKHGDEQDDVELMAPEGGWGYMVCLGFAINFLVTTAPIPSFGFIFNDFFLSLGESSSGATLVTGVFNAVVSCTGFFTTLALKRFTLRQVGVFGSCLFVLGCFMTVFVKNVSQLVLTYGFLEGIGFGVMIPISLTSFNNYFMKRRALMMSVASVLIGSGATVFPTLAQLSMSYYGFRGTLAIICALSFHVILAMVIMQPVEWHLIPRKKNIEEVIMPVNHEYYSEVTVITEKVQNDKNQDLRGSALEICIKNNSKARDPLLRHSLTPKFLEAAGSLRSLTEKRYASRLSVFIKGNDEGFDEKYNTNLAKASSLASLGNWTGNILASEAITNKDGKWKTMVEFFDLSLLKDPVYSNICLGISFSYFSDMMFFLLEPFLLATYGFTEDQIALCITVGAASELVSRSLFTVVNYFVQIKSRYIFLAGTCFIMIFRTAFIQVSNFYPVIILTGCLGFFRNWLSVPLPLVFAEYCNHERFPSAYGLFMMVSGIIMLFLGPLIGYIRDITNSYSFAFYSLNICSLACIIPWTAEMYFNYRHTNKTVK